MFDTYQFISDCRAAVAETDNHTAVHEIVSRAVSEPDVVLKTLGEPQSGGVHKIYHGDDLTIINVVWSPFMTILPHNHEMWTAIGVYTGREDNIYWRRVPDAKNGYIEAAGARSLGVSDAAPLGRDIIHSVTNPLKRFTGAIHVYGGDFFDVERSEWDPESHTEQAYDLAKNVKMFD
ncbi:MAG: putative metal-dependent enzyme (double-stranded beta helix superfamily) [Alphaproteobacteria bacterium]|jgi:predicted metal-dependent enzyme (double-stranded beta helix superfamily)